MQSNKDLCPVYGENHKFFIFKTTEVFERIEVHNWLENTPLEGDEIYKKVEYALMGCNCGAAIKTEVQQK